MRPIYCGNLEKDIHGSELEQLFSKYGKVLSIKIKSGFAFIFMDDERDAEDAIRALNRTEFGRRGRRLQVQWSKQDHGSKAASNARPSKTLFVVNFDPINTTKQDFEKHFGPYGNILDIRMRSDFVFIQFESQEDAMRALEATNNSKLMDCIIMVEYAVCDDERGKGYSSGRRSMERSPDRRSCDCGRSASISTRSSADRRPTKTLFVTKFDPLDTRVRDLERHFELHGKILDVRIKKNFAFIQFESQEDAAAALKATHLSKLRGHVMSVEYVVSDNDGRRNGHSPDGRGHDYVRSRGSSRRSSSANKRPSKTLFVANFDIDTRKHDFQTHFEPYGKILDIRIKNKFAFIQFELQGDATEALEATNMSKLMGHVISVEYAVSDENGKSHNYISNHIVRNGSHDTHDSGFSPSPSRGIKRGSPDYSLGSSFHKEPEQKRRHSHRRSRSADESCSPQG